MKKVLVLLSIFLAIGFFYFWQNKDKEEKENTSIVPDLHKGIAGVNQLKEMRDENPASGPLFYTTDGEAISSLKKTEVFDYTIEDFKSMSLSCGQVYDSVYFEYLINKFEGSSKIIYNFKYDRGDDSSYEVTLIPNKIKYKNLDQFKRDFDVCEFGAEAYPKMLNDNWLLFVSSCGSSFSDNSNIINSCEKARDIIEPNLNFNY